MTSSDSRRATTTVRALAILGTVLAEFVRFTDAIAGRPVGTEAAEAFARHKVTVGTVPAGLRALLAIVTLWAHLFASFSGIACFAATSSTDRITTTFLHIVAVAFHSASGTPPAGGAFVLAEGTEKTRGTAAGASYGVTPASILAYAYLCAARTESSLLAS